MTTRSSGAAQSPATADPPGDSALARLLRAGKAALDRGEPAAALRLFDRAWRSGSRHPSVAALLGLACARAGLPPPAQPPSETTAAPSRPIDPAQRRRDEDWLAASGPRFALLATLKAPGGVERHIGDRVRLLSRQGLAPLVLRPSDAADEVSIEVAGPGPPGGSALRWARSEGPGPLLALCARLGLERFELHHFLGFDPRLVEALLAGPWPSDVFLHDYLWICPRINLITGDGGYCGTPETEICERCVARFGAEAAEATPVSALRARSARWLAAARSVTAPSADAAARFRRRFPRVDLGVAPHEPVIVRRPPTPPASGVVRIAVIGAIGSHKGYDVVLGCARDAAARDLPLEFVVIGHTLSDDELMATGKAFVTGPYQESEVAGLIARERPHAAFVPSVWPETWCYALTHAIEAGLPVAAFDLGAVAERLRGLGLGRLVPLGASSSLVNNLLVNLDFGGTPPAAALDRPPATPTSPWRPRMTLPASPAPHGADLAAFAATSRLVSAPRGLYLFSVRAASPSSTQGAGAIAAPAMHVGLAPGVAAGQVETLHGPDTQGGWLSRLGQMLVARVESDATFVLTSFAGRGGEQLAIDIERLDSQVETAEPLDPAAAPAPPPAPAVPLEIIAHVHRRGDMSFIDAEWAGVAGEGLWIEAFGLSPLDRLDPAEIEYKALTAAGVETPWAQGGQGVGTSGMATPLLGFAVRLRGRAATVFDCAYSGRFRSGAEAGPMRQGAPCRSPIDGDPLEALQVRLVERPKEALPAVAHQEVGPRFSKLREDAERAAAAPPQWRAPRAPLEISAAAWAEARARS